MSFASTLEFVFYGWAVGFAFAVCFHYAAKAFFGPVGVLRFWDGPS